MFGRLGRRGIRAYRHLVQPPATPCPDELRATFFGVSTLLFRAGGNAVMIDGFFSRPRLARVLAGRIAPDHEVIVGSLQRAGVTDLDAVIPVHSHYDHALDAPAVAAMTGASVVGSASTVNIARGYGLPPDRIYQASVGEVLRFGRITVTMVAAEHSPTRLARGVIRRPVRPPAHASAYRMGECFSVLVECDGRTVLVNGSAGFIPGMLRDHPAEAVYFGIPLLGRQREEFRDELWREVVVATGARRVLPIHWDAFWRPLDQPLVPLPRLVDDFDVSMRFLAERCREAGVDLVLPAPWRVTDPFAGL